MSQLKRYRAVGIALFEDVSSSLAEKGLDEQAQEVKQWSDDWLGLLGVSTGLTGLARDFALNYLGRSAYHDNNGPLLDAIHEIPEAIRHRQKDLRLAVKRTCERGMDIFEKDGALFNMLAALAELVRNEDIYASFQKALKANAEIRGAFEYFGGLRPEAEGFDDLQEQEL